MNVLRKLNERYRKDFTQDKMKNQKKKRFHPRSTKCTFGKASGSVKSTAPPTGYPNSVTQIVITDAKKGFKEIKIGSPDKLIRVILRLIYFKIWSTQITMHINTEFLLYLK